MQGIHVWLAAAALAIGIGAGAVGAAESSRERTELSQRAAAVTGERTHSAGDVAFIHWNTDGVHVLRRDGTVWTCPSCGWVPDDEPYDLSPPVPTADIAAWELVTFLDKKGDVWLFTESLGWRNYGHP